MPSDLSKPCATGKAIRERRGAETQNGEKRAAGPAAGVLVYLAWRDGREAIIADGQWAPSSDATQPDATPPDVGISLGGPLRRPHHLRPVPIKGTARRIAAGPFGALKREAAAVSCGGSRARAFRANGVLFSGAGPCLGRCSVRTHGHVGADCARSAATPRSLLGQFFLANVPLLCFGAPPTAGNVSLFHMPALRVVRAHCTSVRACILGRLDAWMH